MSESYKFASFGTNEPIFWDSGVALLGKVEIGWSEGDRGKESVFRRWRKSSAGNTPERRTVRECEIVKKVKVYSLSQTTQTSGTSRLRRDWAHKCACKLEQVDNLWIPHINLIIFNISFSDMSGSVFNKLREDDKNESWEGQLAKAGNQEDPEDPTEWWSRPMHKRPWMVRRTAGPLDQLQCCLAGLVAEEVTLSVRERSHDPKIGWIKTQFK